MRRVFKYIIFMFFLAGISRVYIALAEENSASALIKRPRVEYKSGQLRDPFKSYLRKDQPGPDGRLPDNLTQSKINLDSFKVQGIIWGGEMPQAIINNKVLAVGDLIDGAQILNIDKSGITLNISGEIVNLSAPGQ